MLAQGVSEVQPSLNLPFAQAFAAAMAQLTFSRASLATQIGSTGLVEWCPMNLVRFSQQIDNAGSWASVTSPTMTGNAAAAPDGTITATQMTTSAFDGKYQGVTGVVGQPHTFSVYAKYVSGATNIQIGWDGGTTPYGIFNVQTGAFVSQGGGLSSYGSSYVGNGWYRFWVTFTATVSGMAAICYLTGAGTCLFWGYQVDLASAPRQYNVTTNAVYYGPRLTYDPTTLAPLGLLVEEQRTNLCLYSRAITTTNWNVVTGVTIPSTTVLAPDGTNTASTVNILAFSYLASNLDIPFTAGVTGSISAWVKKSVSSPATNIRLVTNNTGAWNTGISQQFALTNSWQRIVMTGVLISSGTAIRFGFGSYDAAAGNDATCIGNVDIWGVQVEQGDTQTSYIDTTSSAVTRSADVVYKTNPPINTAQGTILCNFVRLVTDSPGFLFAANDGSTANRVDIRLGQSFAMVSGASVDQTLGATPPGANSGIHKTGVVYGPNACYHGYDGGAITATAGKAPAVSPTILWLCNGDAGNFQSSAIINSLICYPIAVNSPTLQALTR